MTRHTGKAIFVSGLVLALAAGWSGDALGRRPSAPAKYVITGGPGVGKTTLLNGLRKSGGFEVVRESARRVIRREQARERLARMRGSSYTPVAPWNDTAAFQAKVLAHQQNAEAQAVKRASGSGNDILLDRSAIDGIAYLIHNGHSPLENYTLYKKHIQQVRKAGYTKVLFLDPLPSYVNDRQRRESPAEAARIHEKLYSVYKRLGDRYGFEVVRVPALPIPQRIERARALLKE